MTSVMYSSSTDEWATPLRLFSKLDDEFHFSVDVCADETNKKCDRYYSKEENGLKQQWNGVCWMNPPYGRSIGQWMEKAVKSMLEGGAVVVCLIPARTDTKWWHKWVMPYASEIRFLAGRLKFGNAETSAPFPSAIVIYRQERTPVIKAYKED